MPTLSYETRRGQLQTYFDRTALEAWRRLTSDAPVSGIRATVRAGREAMRETLLGWLPDDLGGRRILDAGCGTGAMAYALAARGADVVGVDLSASLLAIARQRAPATGVRGQVRFRRADMLDSALGGFDHVVAMDSLIHYRSADMVETLAALAERTGSSLLFTFAPRTPLLTVMHAVGRSFPRSDRAPAIVPVSERALRRRLGHVDRLGRFGVGRGRRISSGFYTSQAMELCGR